MHMYAADFVLTMLCCRSGSYNDLYKLYIFGYVKAV